MKENKKRKFSVASICNVLIKILTIVFTVGFIGICIYGHHNFEHTYTEYTTAIKIKESVEDYLYAPYHGGRVQTRYNYYYTYEYIVDDKPYYLNIKSVVKIDTSDVTVRYSKDNPEDVYFDKNDLYANPEEVWVKY